MRAENRLLIKGREAPDTVVNRGLEESRNEYVSQVSISRDNG
jgi:hypothetical protein